jgi:hypothetical protein
LDLNEFGSKAEEPDEPGKGSLFNFADHISNLPADIESGLIIKKPNALTLIDEHCRQGCDFSRLKSRKSKSRK